MNAIAVIKANYTDLLDDDRDPSHYCLESLRKSRHIDRIVIAAHAQGRALGVVSVVD